jgi:hypothetical protein
MGPTIAIDPAWVEPAFVEEAADTVMATSDLSSGGV